MVGSCIGSICINLLLFAMAMICDGNMGRRSPVSIKFFKELPNPYYISQTSTLVRPVPMV